MKQKEQLAAQEQKLEELTLKIEDVETLVEEVSDIAYDKAVEVVTDAVRLMQPEVKQAGKQQIQEKAKESILAFLKKPSRIAHRENTTGKSSRQNRIWSGKASDFAKKSDAFL